MQRSRLFVLLLPFAALLALTPLLLHGVSCGHDLGFHTLSWLDAAQQMRHGTLYPRWAPTPAWNAGEPRFVFYPPLSWMLGAVLTMVFPMTVAPVVFLWLALTGAGLSMYKLARHFTSPGIAFFAAALYVVNPYMLFNAFERSALAELLASVWMPLLLLGLLRTRPTARGIALPLALLWLTNAPAAVMGSYLLALVGLVRCLARIRPTPRNTLRDGFHFALTFLGGAVLGLALPAFYLVPAAYERRFVQVAMAILPNMRFQDNFLFAHTGDAPHNVVNHTASLIALTVLVATAVFVGVCLLPRKPQPEDDPAPGPSIPGPSTPSSSTPGSSALWLLALITVAITFLLVPLSTPVWNHLPDLAFLQFPWRLMTILAVVAALAFALVVERLQLDTKRLLVALPLLLLALTFGSYSQTAQVCESGDGPVWLAGVVASGHGVPATDEYTPNDADNDVQRTANPGFWFIPGAKANPDTPAPGTHPSPVQVDPNFDGNIPLSETASAHAPAHVTLHAAGAGVLVLNLRDYPGWQVTAPLARGRGLERPRHIPRDDGLIALPIASAGDYAFDIAWRHTPDEWIGGLITVLALLDLLLARLWR